MTRKIVGINLTLHDTFSDQRCLVCNTYYDRDSWSLIVGFMILAGTYYFLIYPTLLIFPLIQVLGSSSRSSHSVIYVKCSILRAQPTSYVVSDRMYTHLTTIHPGFTLLHLAHHHRTHIQDLRILNIQNLQGIPAMVGIHGRRITMKKALMRLM